MPLSLQRPQAHSTYTCTIVHRIWQLPTPLGTHHPSYLQFLASQFAFFMSWIHDLSKFQEIITTPFVGKLQCQIIRQYARVKQRL